MEQHSSDATVALQRSSCLVSDLCETDRGFHGVLEEPAKFAVMHIEASAKAQKRLHDLTLIENRLEEADDIFGVNAAVDQVPQSGNPLPFVNANLVCAF